MLTLSAQLMPGPQRDSRWLIVAARQDVAREMNSAAALASDSATHVGDESAGGRRNFQFHISGARWYVS